MTEFDQYSENYKKTVESALPIFSPPLEFYAKQKANFLKTEIDKSNPIGSLLELLNFGCGTGQIDGYLNEMNVKITGVDPSESSLTYARKSNPQNIYQEIPEDHLPEMGKKFDLIYAACVFHHIPTNRHEAILKDIHHHLKKGGKLIIFEHNPWNPLTRWITSRCKLDQNARLIDANALTEQIRNSGFQVTGMKYYLFLPLGGAFWMWAEKALLSWLPLGCQYFIVAQKR
jgi:SAM-dependent methyltransferase